MTADSDHRGRSARSKRWARIRSDAPGCNERHARMDPPGSAGAIRRPSTWEDGERKTNCPLRDGRTPTGVTRAANTPDSTPDFPDHATMAPCEPSEVAT